MPVSGISICIILSQYCTLKRNILGPVPRSDDVDGCTNWTSSSSLESLGNEWPTLFPTLAISVAVSTVLAGVFSGSSTIITSGVEFVLNDCESGGITRPTARWGVKQKKHHYKNQTQLKRKLPVNPSWFHLNDRLPRLHLQCLYMPANTKQKLQNTVCHPILTWQ